ncbi:MULTISPECIES: citrate (Si)-synthase, eukaryotic [Chitinophagaceae]
MKEKFQSKAEAKAAEIKAFLKEYGTQKLEETAVSQVFQGMRGMTGLVYETSLLDANEGIRFRGYSIPDLQAKLPSAEGGSEPLPEGVFYLMLTGELPSKEDVAEVDELIKGRKSVPSYVFAAIDALPVATHPMTQFVVGIMALQTESKFAKAYGEGINKKEYWDFVFEDALDLIAKLPRIAAYIYRRKYKNNEQIESDPSLDWAGDLAHMLGYNDPSFKELMRLYMTIHSDHEGGNVSAHTTHLVGSALSDPYLSLAAGMNGLAGPLHGLANQEVIKWVFEMTKTIGTDEPSKEQISAYVKETLANGKVVPGYGHAVLRITDPRFTAQQKFAEKHMNDDKLVQTIWNIYDVVPPILEATGKVKNPWPNVDAHSGALLVHYGLKEYEFYTVLFGVSRALGVLASLIWSRALGFAIERPKSITSDVLIAEYKK